MLASIADLNDSEDEDEFRNTDLNNNIARSAK